jgi:hypothetical protein
MIYVRSRCPAFPAQWLSGEDHVSESAPPGTIALLVRRSTKSALIGCVPRTISPPCNHFVTSDLATRKPECPRHIKNLQTDFALSFLGCRAAAGVI